MSRDSWPGVCVGRLRPQDVREGRGPVTRRGTYMAEFTGEALAVLLERAWVAVDPPGELRFQAHDEGAGEDTVRLIATWSATGAPHDETLG